METKVYIKVDYTFQKKLYEICVDNEQGNYLALNTQDEINHIEENHPKISIKFTTRMCDKVFMKIRGQLAITLDTPVLNRGQMGATFSNMNIVPNLQRKMDYPSTKGWLNQKVGMN